MKRPEGPPATLGSVLPARTRLIVWCKNCHYQIEPDTTEQARRYGAAKSVPDYAKRLVCSQCGTRNTDFVLTGARK